MSLQDGDVNEKDKKGWALVWFLDNRPKSKVLVQVAETMPCVPIRKIKTIAIARIDHKAICSLAGGHAIDRGLNSSFIIAAQFAPIRLDLTEQTGS